MSIRRPTFYPEPWASDEAMDALTPDEMSAGYPAGTSEKPSRQSINGVLQYATNGVLYYLIRGVPEWISAAAYNEHAIVIFNGRYFLALTANTGLQPDTNTAAWENLPWRKSELDDIFMSKTDATNQFLTMAQADARYYLRSQADATFLRQVDAAFQFVTQAALDANYITREQADALFLTLTQADARYARLGEVVTQTQLTETLADYITTTEAEATFMTPAQADERFMTPDQASAIFETQTNAAALYLQLANAGMSVWDVNATYRLGALVLDLNTGLVYRSLQNDNQHNLVSNPAWWGAWPPPDTNGMFLNLLAFESAGTFEVTADQIPMLADHPGGIFLKVILKSPGGSNYFYGGGGGEGGCLEVVFQDVTADLFPVQIIVPAVELGYGTEFRFQGADSTFRLVPYPGKNGDYNTPGDGGATYLFEPAEVGYTYLRFIQGADGRQGTPGLRGGDGGGAHGSSGTPATAAPTKAMYGCGGGGGGLAPATANGGDGYVLIYW